MNFAGIHHPRRRNPIPDRARERHMRRLCWKRAGTPGLLVDNVRHNPVSDSQALVRCDFSEDRLRDVKPEFLKYWPIVVHVLLVRPGIIVVKIGIGDFTVF